YCAYPPLFCFRTLTFFPDPATTHIYTLSLHDALPISIPPRPISSPTSYRPLIIRCWDTVFLIGRYAAGPAPVFGEVVWLVEPEETEASPWSSVPSLVSVSPPVSSGGSSVGSGSRAGCDGREDDCCGCCCVGCCRVCCSCVCCCVGCCWVGCSCVSC